MSQKELLEEAKITEKKNRESLQKMLQIEEEKKKIPTRAPRLTGPLIVYHSKDGKDTITFTEVESVPPEINSKAPPCISSSFALLMIDQILPSRYAQLQVFLRSIWIPKH